MKMMMISVILYQNTDLIKQNLLQMFEEEDDFQHGFQKKKKKSCCFFPR